MNCIQFKNLYFLLSPPLLIGVLAVGIFGDDTELESTSGRLGLIKGELFRLNLCIHNAQPFSACLPVYL